MFFLCEMIERPKIYTKQIIWNQISSVYFSHFQCDSFIQSIDIEYRAHWIVISFIFFITIKIGIWKKLKCILYFYSFHKRNEFPDDGKKNLNKNIERKWNFFFVFCWQEIIFFFWKLEPIDLLYELVCTTLLIWINKMEIITNY